ncbi:MAG: helix-turn-helix domain-containing protein [Parvibaculum sp.]|nr:helix-turn-helix domain-containing protein [Parvibaculum sp.]MDP1628842.1 helix-turn-helix domain-containing protein [Parvibaculum sp.]MDP2148237.1 helix-turn-helix domain-containing protein [Parvibaculum sp.]
MSDGLQEFAVAAVREAQRELRRESLAEEARRWRLLERRIERAGKDVARAETRAARRLARLKAVEQREIAALESRKSRLTARISEMSMALRQRETALEAIDAALWCETGLTLAALRGKSRTRRLARPRQLGMWLARMTTPLSFPAIAHRWHRDDHTTAIHAVRTVAGWQGELAAWRDRLLAEVRQATGQEGLPAA